LNLERARRPVPCAHFACLIRRLATLSLLSVGAVAVACESAPDSAGDAHQSAFVEGTVLDGLRAPIAGAKVTMLAPVGGKAVSATADANGRFGLQVEGIGTFGLEATAEGHTRIVTSFAVGDIPDVPGFFKANTVVNPTLFKKTASVRGRLLRQRGDQAPLADVTVLLRLNDGTIQDQTIVTTTTTDADGVFNLEGLPSGSTGQLLVAAIDLDGDLQPDTAAVTQNVTFGFDTATAVTMIAGDFEAPQAVWSNARDALLSPTSRLSVFYNVAMDETPGRSTVTLTQTSPSNFQVAKTTAWQDGSTTIEVTPTSSLTPGARYTLTIEAFTATTQQQVNANFTFSVEADSTAPGAPSDLALDDDGEAITNTQTAFPIVFDGVADGQRYTAYARRVDGIVADWIAATTINSGEPIVRATVNMPSQLRLADSNTLFSAGNTYEIAVTATINGIESPLSAPIELRDESCPLVTVVQQESATGTWNNTTGETALPVRLNITFDEFVDHAASPTITFDGAVLSSSDFTFGYLTGNSGRFVSEIDPGVNGGGQLLTISYANVSDRSGNLNCEVQIPVERTTF
jgi:hypothetical protein